MKSYIKKKTRVRRKRFVEFKYRISRLCFSRSYRSIYYILYVYSTFKIVIVFLGINLKSKRAVFVVVMTRPFKSQRDRLFRNNFYLLGRHFKRAGQRTNGQPRE